MASVAFMLVALNISRRGWAHELLNQMDEKKKSKIINEWSRNKKISKVEKATK